MEKLSTESVDITRENIEKIKELFPQVVTEGKIDFDVLKETLGEQIESRNERYQFTWNGKSDSIRFAQRPSTGTLRPDKESSKNWDSTENLYIEGDNLEVLKLLQKSYHNKIKMIYIDPPYNTGGDFVYKDDFKDSIKNYKEQTNQTLRANPETSGRYHTDWLNMMYPRLMLAKNLLSEDGVIFISIDDKEIENLKKISSEVFGESNFCGQFMWFKSATPPNLSFKIKKNLEYVLCYQKMKNSISFKGIKKSSPSDDPLTKPQNSIKELTFPSNSINCKFEDGIVTRGIYGTKKFPNQLLSDFEVKDGKNVNPVTFSNRFIWTQEKLDYEILQDIRISLSKNLVLSYKRSNYNEEVPPNLIDDKVGVGTTEEAGKKLDLIFNVKNIFDYPKDVSLIEYLASFLGNKSDIYLDFFSGSSTTAHAIMQLNSEDGGNRKFIMVQLPEKTDEKSEAYKAGYKNICEIGKERIRRAGDKIKNELIEKRNKQGMIEDTIDPEQLDIGFKVFKLDTSNLKTFDSTSKNLENIFSEDVFLPERSSLDILYEILLKYGVFDKPVNVIQINGKEAFSIAMNQTIVYINQTITESDVLAIAKLAPREVIFDERGFVNDNDKINALKRLETAGVEKVATI